MMTRYPGKADDTDFALRLIREAGVAAIPGSSFYTDDGDDWIRFTFSRNEEPVDEAVRRLDENRF